MKWPDERPCKDNTAHEKETGFYCESKVFTLTGQVSNPDPSTPTIRPLVLPRNTQQIFYASN